MDPLSELAAKQVIAHLFKIESADLTQWTLESILMLRRLGVHLQEVAEIHLDLWRARHDPF